MPSGQSARPPRASWRQSNFGPGSALRPGAMSEWAITPAGGMPQRAMMSSSRRLERGHLRLGERREAGERPRRWRARCRSSASSCRRAHASAGAGVPGARRFLDQAPDAAVLGEQVVGETAARIAEAARAPPRRSASRCSGAPRARAEPVAARAEVGARAGRSSPCAARAGGPMRCRCRTASPPDGSLHGVAARGTLMGNRGGRLHRADGTLGAARWSSRAWIACLPAFRGRHRRSDGRGATPSSSSSTRRRRSRPATAPASSAAARPPGPSPRPGRRRPRRRGPPRWTGAARRAPGAPTPGVRDAAGGRRSSRRTAGSISEPAARWAGASRATARAGRSRAEEVAAVTPASEPRRWRPATGRRSPEPLALAQRAVGRRVPAAGEAVAVRVEAVAVRLRPAAGEERAGPRRRRGSGRSCRRSATRAPPSGGRSTRRPRCRTAWRRARR